LVGPDATTDAAFPLIIRNLVPAGVRGFIFAAIGGAVMSSLASMLNSASTIFTMDIYKRMLNNDPDQKKTVVIGRIATGVFLLIGCLIAPVLDNPALKGIFTYIQEFQGFISPGILAAFAFGMLIKKAPKKAGVMALILNPIIYGLLLIFFGQLPVFESVNIAEIAFLNRMAITFIIIIVAMGIMTIINPLDTPVTLPKRKDFDSSSSPIVKRLGILVIAIVIVLYIIFW
ncbi:MAG: transporter, partial [Candidatus Marinimicrobia bacterium]|nr:transporter [Candidatus Neomarinimicrobiota bacterium]